MKESLTTEVKGRLITIDDLTEDDDFTTLLERFIESISTQSLLPLCTWL